MADEHSPEHHGGANVKLYMTVFLALCIFTALSFVVNLFEPVIGISVGVAIILLVAVCKATLVTMFFMHVKWDWGKLFFIIIPVVILAIMMMVVLLPDQVVAWHHEPIE